MQYDAIIVGSGQAGAPLSYALADLGWKVALIEKGHLGGTCINNGCTPTKTMVHRALVAHYARDAARWGVRAENVNVDLPTIVAQKNKVVQSFRDGRQRQIDRRPNMRLYRSPARFVGPISLNIAGELLESEKIFINTGGRPRIPAIAGLDEALDAASYLTNEDIMDLTTVPAHLLVLGGGYIGLEFGQMFRRFGSEVTVIQGADQIVPREDPEVAAELQKILEAEGIKFLVGAQTTRAEKHGESITLTVEIGGKSSTVSGSHLLVATGRAPNTHDLDLDKAGIATDQFGFIHVDGKLETSVPGVWALGDVKGGPGSSRTFSLQRLPNRLCESNSRAGICRSITASCPIASSPIRSSAAPGLTEKEARAKGYRLKIGTIGGKTVHGSSCTR